MVIFLSFLYVYQRLPDSGDLTNTPSQLQPGVAPRHRRTSIHAVSLKHLNQVSLEWQEL